MKDMVFDVNFSFPNSVWECLHATLRVASQKELYNYFVFGERSTRSVEEGIPKRSLGTRNEKDLSS